MIDIEKCKLCPNIRSLVEKGLGSQAINTFAEQGRYGASANCQKPPAEMPGGWMKCHTDAIASAAMRGANVALEMTFEPQESMVTV